MKNELFERELQNTSINDVSLADYVKENYLPISVLDKIRAEIEALNPVDYVSMSSYEGHRGASDMKDDVLRIIDKYRAESEEV